MRIEKAFRFRPAYGYAAAVVCVALAAWGAVNPPPTLGIVQTLDQTDLDTQLPLERFAVAAGNAAASSSRALRQTEQSLPLPLPRHAERAVPQDRRISGDTRNEKAEAGNGFARLSTPRRKSNAHDDYRTIENWKNWT
jgi:hypothetical protein